MKEFQRRIVVFMMMLLLPLLIVATPAEALTAGNAVPACKYNSYAILDRVDRVCEYQTERDTTRVFFELRNLDTNNAAFVSSVQQLTGSQQPTNPNCNLSVGLQRGGYDFPGCTSGSSTRANHLTLVGNTSIGVEYRIQTFTPTGQEE